MDYGYQGNSEGDMRGTPFFTSGNMANIEDESATRHEQPNINTSEWAAPLERDKQKIGREALNIPDNSVERPSREGQELADKGYRYSEMQNHPIAQEAPSVDNLLPPRESIDDNAHNVKIINDKLTNESIKAIDEKITKLNQDGDISSFYEDTRGMMVDNLENSFGRKLAA